MVDPDITRILYRGGVVQVMQVMQVMQVVL